VNPGSFVSTKNSSEIDPRRRKLEPFLKWAGGKRWAVAELVRHAPPVFDRYVEPFLGGASLFFALQPQSAVLADVNSELINAYRCVRDRAGDLQRWLRWLEERHSASLYYKIRDKSGGSAFWRALRFVYLNRTCWNGLYRVNLKGEFNVPIGTKTAICFNDGLSSQAALLQRAELRAQDFETTIATTGRGDFLYVDPPYTVRHNNNGFLKYNEKIFTWKDQERLRLGVEEAKGRGAMVLISNAAHSSVRDLYGRLGEVIELERSSVLAASSRHRRRESEVLIKCY
jgi:DNA adenine methylase